MPIIDFSKTDTTPGNGGPFCPPAGFVGDAVNYSQWLRERFATDPGIAQAMFVAWRFRVTSPGTALSHGPYSEALEAAIRRFEGWCKSSSGT